MGKPPGYSYGEVEWSPEGRSVPEYLAKGRAAIFLRLRIALWSAAYAGRKEC
jgi:hypothetical protein